MSEILNKTLRISCPEGFHVMDAEELSAMTFVADGPGICLSDPERHMIISIGYKGVGGLASLLVSGKDAAAHMERQIGEPMKPNGFRKTDTLQAMIGGKQMDGLGYCYTAQETPMYAQSYVIKYKKTFYYFHFYTREVLAEENIPVWEAFLQGASWEA